MASRDGLIGARTEPSRYWHTNYTIPPHTPAPVTEVAVPSRNPDPSQFKELQSIKPTRKPVYQIVEHISTTTAATITPIYTLIENDRTFQAQKPDIQLYFGAERKTGPLAGVVKFHHVHAREFVIGVGDPHVLAEDEPGREMIWESLRRGEKWRHISYVFEFGTGQHRRVYTWRRTVKYWSNYVKDMELRVGGLEEKDGELVALWTGSSWYSLKKGTLFLKERLGDEEHVSNWEVVVLLTAMAIIENAVRRSK